MDFMSLFSNPHTPAIVLCASFAAIAYYFEAKPQLIAFGVVCVILVHITNDKSADKALQRDYNAIRQENEHLKQNLMQVYSMVQEKKQQSQPKVEPPPYISQQAQASPVDQSTNKQEEEEGKPYV